MRCRRCSASLPQGAAFCPECGLAVEQTPPASVWSPPQQPVSPSEWDTITSPPTASLWEAAPASPTEPPTYPPVPPTYQAAPTTYRAAPTTDQTRPAPHRTRLVIGVAALVLVAGAATTVLLLQPDSLLSTTTTTTSATSDQPSSEPSARSSQPTRPTTSARVTQGRVPTPGISAEDEAVATLYTRSSADAETVSFDGRWVAQLASKYVGIQDPYQTTASGSHTFGAADILAESDALAARVTGARVVLLNSMTYGKRFAHDGKPLWVTMALNPAFTSQESVIAWCAGQFPELTGKQLTNQCMPNRLNP